MPEEIVREYRMEDEAMLVRAEVIQNQLVADLADFTAKFPFMDATYAAAIEASINAANALPLDDQVVSNLKVLTADVNAQMLLGRSALSALNVYAQLAYPNDEARQRVFGQDNWADAYNDQEKMMNALEHAHSMATQAPYDADLAAKGFTAADAANLQTIANEIRTKNQLQENAKANRPVSTQDRIVQYNSVWNQIKEINLTSKVVFVDNPAKLESYQLYPSSAATTTVNITVLNSGAALRDAEVRITNSSLATQNTNADGIATFVSNSIPELINIEVSHPDTGTQSFNDQNITTGTSNDLTVEVG